MSTHSVSLKVLPLVFVLLAPLGAHAACPDASVFEVFTALPYSPQDLNVILPLGDIGPPNHTLPVHHMYYQSYPDGQSGYTEMEVRSPGTMRIIAIEDDIWNPNDLPDDRNYAVQLELMHQGQPCEQIRMYMHHIEVLDPAIAAQVGDLFDGSPGTATIGSRVYKFGLNIPLAPGQALGISRGIHPNLDIGLIDRRLGMVGYVKPERYDPLVVIDDLLDFYQGLYPWLTAELALQVMPDRNHQRCALDYFTPALKAAQESKLGSPSGLHATGNPPCQTHMRDAPGTIAGNWVDVPYTGPESSLLVTDEFETLAIGPYNVQPDQRHLLGITQPLVDDGGFPPPPPGEEPVHPGAYYYTPYASGSLINPKGDATVAGPVYCFERVVWNEMRLLEGVVLVKLGASGDTLKAKILPGGPLCSMHPGYADKFEDYGPLMFYR